MIGFGVFSFLAGALQLSVPSYALRLVRRFGAQRVGWFVVVAFVSLALLYLIHPFKGAGGAAASPMPLRLVYLVAPALLLIGMGHLETLCSERQQAERREQRQRSQAATEVLAQIADLRHANEELLLTTARLERHARALEASEAEYRCLFADNPLPMWILDLRSGRFLLVNEAAQRQYGYTREEFISLRAGDLAATETASAFLQDIAQTRAGTGSRGVWRHRRKDRTALDVEIMALDLRFRDCPARLMLAQDLGPRRQRERELCLAQKMETLGQVAGGVAHHFNNLLTVISGHTEILLRKPLDPDMTGQLQKVSTAANRAAILTRQLLAAAGRQRIDVQALDLNSVLKRLDPMLRRLIGQRISLRQTCAAHLPAIVADAHLLEHIIVHLVLNAREAMSAGGELDIKTALVRAEAAAAHGPRQGEFVRLTVRDTGCGMAPEVQARLFEPFFTTRDVGQGDGLGLASIQGVLQQHGGWIEYTSQANAGTEFRVFFPTAPPGTDSANPSPKNLS